MQSVARDPRPRPTRSARRLLLAVAAPLLLGACGTFGLGGDEPVAPGDPELTVEQRKARCDQFAAQAIESVTFAEASRIAARAADCYAQEAERGM